jgi:hypothetical protein
MEIGLEQLEGWPTLIQLGDKQFELRYEVRPPTTHESREGKSDHVWHACADFNGYTHRGSGDCALEAVFRLADELNRAMPRSSTRFSVDFPLSWLKTRTDILAHGSWSR